MSAMLPADAVRPWLALCGVTPADDPAAYDYLQREFDAWWAAGGSARAFVEAHKRYAPADFGIGDDGQLPRLSGRSALRILERRYPAPWMP
jgi:hypothetical protein